MKKNVLVFGGSGFIGRNLCNLLADDYHVISADNNERAYKQIDLDERVERVNCDIVDINSVTKVVEKADIILNLAYINGTQNFYTIPGRILEIASFGQLNIDFALRNLDKKIEKFVYCSSAETYQNSPIIPTPEDTPLVVPDPHNPRFSYGGGKIFGELTTINMFPNALKKSIFRPHNIYGPNMSEEHVIPQLLKNIYEKMIADPSKDTIDLQIQGTGEETRSFCYVSDCVSGIKKLVDNDLEGTYHIGNDHEITINELIGIMGEYLGKKINIIPGELLPGSVKRRVPNINKMRSNGYSPAVDIVEGVALTSKWYIDSWNAKLKS